MARQWTDEDRVDLRFFFNALSEAGTAEVSSGVGSNWGATIQIIAGLGAAVNVEAEQNMVERLEAVDRLRRVAGALEALSGAQRRVLAAAYTDQELRELMSRTHQNRFGELAGVIVHLNRGIAIIAMPVDKLERLAQRALRSLDAAKSAYAVAAEASA